MGPAGTRPAPTVTVKAWSTEFFALVKKYPQLTKYLFAGTRLLLNIDGVIIQITD